MQKKRKSPKEIFLKPWDEWVGTFRGLRTSKGEITIALSLTDGQALEISSPRALVEEKNILKELHGDMIGQKIAIMKLDDRKNSILIRTIFPEEEDN